MRKRILVTTLIVVLLGMLVYSVVSAGILHRTLLDEAEVALAAVAAMYDGGGADDEAAAALSKDTGGMTVIIVTHEPTIAAYADREIIVRDGQIAPDHLAANGPRPASASRPTVNQLASRLNSQEAHHER